MLGRDMHNRAAHVQDFKIPLSIKTHITEINNPITSIIYSDHSIYHTQNKTTDNRMTMGDS